LRVFFYIFFGGELNFNLKSKKYLIVCLQELAAKEKERSKRRDKHKKEEKEEEEKESSPEPTETPKGTPAHLLDPIFQLLCQIYCMITVAAGSRIFLCSCR
jgi:hypothetical protein